MWLVHVYWWLEANNLWKAAVAWSVGLLLNSLWAVQAWQRHRKRSRQQQAELLDKLDVNTPGGIADLARIMRRDTEPDDNGTDGSQDWRKQDRFGHGEAGREGPAIRGGSGSAGHR